MNKPGQVPPGVATNREDGFLAALAALDGVGPARLRWLLSVGSPPVVWKMIQNGALVVPRARSARIDAALLSRWGAEARSCADLPARMAARMERLGVTVLSGQALPAPLLQDEDPPPILFSRGTPVSQRCAVVAVVGTRRASSYGLRIAEQLGRDLSDSGVLVVSGLALGIDAAAHSGALQGAGMALAVVGAGHDRPCPARNRALAERLLHRGSILSEVPPGVGSAPWRYPVRNRIIAALAHVVVVVESATVGGSMSTVAEALTRDRTVMAVPGPVGRRSSEGCHDLLRDGAEICTGAGDVLTLLGLTCAVPVDAMHLSPEGDGVVGGGSAKRESGRTPGAGSELARGVVELLAEGPMTVDAVVVRSGGDMSEVSSVIAQLEQGGVLGREGGWIRLRAG